MIGDGPPRPSERAGAHAAEALRADPGGVQGSAVLASAWRVRPRLDGRRQVPRRRPRRAPRRSAADTWSSSMPPNPSHLEAVEPGAGRHGARGGAPTWTSPGRPAFDHERSLPILIHGDAAFPGQGMVAETLNLSRLAGYDVGGTIHIIANNQLGFTAEPHESFSTSYASGLARGFKIPIATSTPTTRWPASRRRAWRGPTGTASSLDFLIDLVGYRRHGHNEGDEPALHAAPALPAGRRPTPRCASSCAARWPNEGTCRAGRRRGDGAGAFGHDGARLRRARSRSRTSCPPLPEVPPTGRRGAGA